MKKIFLFPLLLAVFSAHAIDVSDEFLKCSQTSDDKARLACFDAISHELYKTSASIAAPTAEYPPVLLEDLKVDIKTLVGKKLSVEGFAQSFADTTMLTKGDMDNTPIMVDTDALPREDRKKLINNCSEDNCQGVFYGIVKDSVIGPQLFVNRVDWKN